MEWGAQRPRQPPPRGRRTRKGQPRPEGSHGGLRCSQPAPALDTQRMRGRSRPGHNRMHSSQVERTRQGTGTQRPGDRRRSSHLARAAPGQNTASSPEGHTRLPLSWPPAGDLGGWATVSSPRGPGHAGPTRTQWLSGPGCHKEKPPTSPGPSATLTVATCFSSPHPAGGAAALGRPSRVFSTPSQPCVSSLAWEARQAVGPRPA